MFSLICQPYLPKMFFNDGNGNVPVCLSSCTLMESQLEGATLCRLTNCDDCLVLWMWFFFELKLSQEIRKEQSHVKAMVWRRMGWSSGAPYNSSSYSPLDSQENIPEAPEDSILPHLSIVLTKTSIFDREDPFVKILPEPEPSSSATCSYWHLL